MHYAIGDLYIKQSNSKDTEPSEKVEQIPVNAQVVVYHPQTVGEVGKLYQGWKGLFRIKKAVDKNVYIVFPEDQPRKELLVHRERLRILKSALPEGSDLEAGNAGKREEQCRMNQFMYWSHRKLRFNLKSVV